MPFGQLGFPLDRAAPEITVIAHGRIQGVFRVQLRDHPAGTQWSGDMCLVEETEHFVKVPGPARHAVYYRYGVDGTICTTREDLGVAKGADIEAVLRRATAAVVKGIESRQAAAFDRDSPTPRRRAFQVTHTEWKHGLPGEGAPK